MFADHKTRTEKLFIQVSSASDEMVRAARSLKKKKTHNFRLAAYLVLIKTSMNSKLCSPGNDEK